MSVDQRKRLLITAAIARLCLSAIALVARSSRDPPDVDAGFAVLEGGVRTPFRAGALPAGVSGRAAPRFTLTDARGGGVSTGDLKGRPYVVTFLYADRNATQHAGREQEHARVQAPAGALGERGLGVARPQRGGHRDDRR